MVTVPLSLTLVIRYGPSTALSSVAVKPSSAFIFNDFFVKLKVDAEGLHEIGAKNDIAS